MADKIAVEGFIFLTGAVLKNDKYINTPLVEITLYGVMSYNNRASVRVKLDDLERALKQLKKEG